MSIDWSIRQVAVPHTLEYVAPFDPRLVVVSVGGPTMGTTWSVSFNGAPDLEISAIRPAIEACLTRIVSQMSTWLDTSELCRFNRSAQQWHPLPDDFHRVLTSALDVARESSGAYDPTIGPLVNLWGFGPAGPRVIPPQRAEIVAARRRCGWRKIEVDPIRTLARHPGGVSVDLSSIAKGFAVDAVCGVLETHGVESFLVEIGGELKGQGTKPDGQPWWVTVEQPQRVDAPSFSKSFDLVIALHGLAVATSGDYRAGFASDGRWYSHTLDPRTGYPVDHSLRSVTVLHSDCMLADAWSTALLVLGTDAGVRLAEAHGLAALFVSRANDGLTPHATSAFDALLRA